MRRILARIARFFYSWRFLKICLWTITLIILFYAEEDWRGARTWAATKAKWEARGISFDPNKYIPPPVPDSQNIAALPMFRPEPNPNDKNMPALPVAIEKALRRDPNRPQQYLPEISYDWTKGEQPDFAKLRKDLSAFYLQVFGTPPASSDPLAQLEAIYPFIAELNAVAATRPYFRLAEDYASQPSEAHESGLLISQIRVAKVLSMHAILALNEKRPELAVADIRTLIKMSTGIAREPSLLSGLVANGFCSITATVVSNGLIVHGWNDAQLAEIQSILAEPDMLANYQHVMRGECIVYALPMRKSIRISAPPKDISQSDSVARAILIDLSWRDGWIDQNLSWTADDQLGEVALMDPHAHRVFVDLAEQRVQRYAESWAKFAPWNILYAKAPYGGAALQRQFSRIQTWMDEGQIACGLERYRLTHGNYPESLDALVPTCIDRLPCDPIDGQAYRYHAQPNGTYLLYSIGWNQKDDGGKAAYFKDPYTQIDRLDSEHSDWVWPTAR